MSKLKFNFSKKISPKEKVEKGVLLVVTYHPSLYCLSKIIRDNLHLLYMSDEVKGVFSPKPIISFRGIRGLSSHLVRAEFTLLGEQLGHLRHVRYVSVLALSRLWRSLGAVSKVKSSARVRLIFRGLSCWEASVTRYLWFQF